MAVRRAIIWKLWILWTCGDDGKALPYRTVRGPYLLLRPAHRGATGAGSRCGAVRCGDVQRTVMLDQGL